MVIIVDGWLKSDMDYFSKLSLAFNRSGIKVVQVKSLAQKELEKVKKEYLEISYNKFTWDFDICEIENESSSRPTTSHGVFFYAMTMAMTEKSCKGFTNTLSQYDNIIVYPSDMGNLIGDFKGYAYLINGPRNVLGNLVFTGIGIPMSPLFGMSPTLINYFSYDTLDHELGHSLGLPHADGYRDCQDGYGSQGCRHAEYGDDYDIMGNGKYIAPNVTGGAHKGGANKAVAINLKATETYGGHLNCYYKESLGFIDSTPATAGNYLIAPLEDLSPQAPQCLVLQVDQDFVDHSLPCDQLYLELRTAREKNVRRLLSRCISPLLPPNDKYDPSSPYDLSTQTQLIFAPPVGKGEYWDTNLGYDIAFIKSAVKGKPSEVSILSYSPCKDGDKDGYRKSGDPANCRLRSFEDPDCDDTDPAIHPGATEICDGKDNNCDGLFDKTPINQEGVFDIVGGFTVCKTCKDTDFGTVGALGGSGGVVLDVQGTVTLELNGKIVESKTDRCGDKDGKNFVTLITEYFCGMKGPEAFIDEWVGDCSKFGKVCEDIGKGATCADPWDCADLDHDGFQVKDSSPRCKFNGKQDCNDNLIDVHPGAKEVCGNKIDDDCDGIVDEGCSKAPTCQDSDGGNIGRVGGKVTYTWFDAQGRSHQEVYTDRCGGFGGAWLVEYYCDGNIPRADHNRWCSCTDPDGIRNVRENTNPLSPMEGEYYDIGPNVPGVCPYIPN